MNAEDKAERRARVTVEALLAVIYMATPMLLLTVTLGGQLGTVLPCWVACSFAAYLYGLKVRRGAL